MSKLKDLPIEGTDFDFVETTDSVVNSQSHNPIIEILNGAWEGIIVQYGKIQMHLQEDPPRLQFDYTVLNGGAFSVETLNADDRFREFLGSIIISTVKKHMDSADAN